MEWLVDHSTELLAAGSAALTLVSIVVRLTPTPKDDAVLAKVMNWVSFLKSKNSSGTLKLPFTKE